MKPATTVAAVLLLLIAVAHVLRLIYGWQLTVADRLVPMWVSGVGLVIAASLAVLLWREARRP
ncbi:MAG TPA: hypothetical protein VLB75_11280 [Steroidobacteraceae bacterium]|nr:hypothetical protein [Steroidobacteraceae bacterium]